MIGPVQSHCHEGSPVGKRSLRWEGFVEKVGLSLEWKSEGVMDDESGDDNWDEQTIECWGESAICLSYFIMRSDTESDPDVLSTARTITEKYGLTTKKLMQEYCQCDRKLAGNRACSYGTDDGRTGIGSQCIMTLKVGQQNNTWNLTKR